MMAITKEYRLACDKKFTDGAFLKKGTSVFLLKNNEEDDDLYVEAEDGYNVKRMFYVSEYELDLVSKYVSE